MKRRADKWLIGVAAMLLIVTVSFATTYFIREGWNPFHRYGYLAADGRAYVIDETGEWMLWVDEHGGKQKMPDTAINSYHVPHPFLGVKLDYGTNPFHFKPAPESLLAACRSHLAAKGEVFGYTEEQLGATAAERDANLLKLIRYYFSSYNERRYGEVEKPELDE